MADTPQIVLTYADTSTLNIFSTNASIDWMTPGLEVVVRDKASGTAAAMNDGYTVDPNNGYRVVTCSVKLTAAEIETLNGKLLPASVPTYDGTDPKIVLQLGATKTFTILCTIKAKAIFISDNSWRVSFTFTERTT